MNNFTDPNKLKKSEPVLNKIWNKLDHVPNKIFGSSKNDLDTFMRNAAKSATLVAITAISFYLVYLVMNILLVQNAEPLQQLGPMGDFFGGILNPIFGFIGLMALLYTLSLNQQELNQATEQMKESAKAAKLQVKQDEIQHLLDSLIKDIDLKLSIRAIVVSGNSKKEYETKNIIFIPEHKIEIPTIDGDSNVFLVNLAQLFLNIAQLTRLCYSHKNLSQSEITIQHYAERYGHIAFQILNYQTFMSEIEKNHIEEINDIKDIIKFLTEYNSEIKRDEEKKNTLKQILADKETNN